MAVTARPMAAVAVAARLASTPSRLGPVARAATAFLSSSASNGAVTEKPAVPTVIATTPEMASVAVTTRPSASVASVATPGPQGAPGPAGADASSALNKGFGTVDYTDNEAGTDLPLPIGQWVRLIRNLTPSAANYNLPSGPWAGFQFWDNGAGLLRARARGDLLLIKFTFTVIPDQQAGGIRFAVRPGDNPAFDFGPEPIVLTADAGEAQTGSETFFTQCRPRFVDQGAQIYIMATTGGTLTQFSPEITPIGFS